MRERYPTDTTIPADHLVPPELQPEFTELPGQPIPELANTGVLISDAHVQAGRGEQPATIHGESGRAYTFAELAAASDRLAAGLVALGIQRGDRIAYRTANVPELAIVAAATWKAGGVLVPTPAQAREQELRFFLEDVGARVLFVLGRSALFAAVPDAVEGTNVEHVIAFGHELEDVPGRSWEELMSADASGFAAVETPRDSVAVIWHTGGITGQPKACYHTHRRMIAGAYALAAGTGMQTGQRWAAAAPVGHALGFGYHTTWTLINGATAVIVEDFANPTALLAAVEERRITTLTGISLTWSRMLEELEQGAPYDVSSLERAYAMYQSASSSHVYDGWLDRGVELRNNFGATAFSSWVLAPDPAQPCPRASLGRPVPGYTVAAIELDGEAIVPVAPGAQGRMAVQGPTGLTYWNRPELQRRDVRDGWTLVDDLIVYGEDGNATHLGRTDYIINSAGYKVAPVEVEEVLSKHDAVREVGVVGAPDAIRHEVVTAFVALEDGVEPSAELRAELQAYVKERLAPYKYPRRVEFVERLPRDHVGKLEPRVLKEWAERGSEQSA